MLQVERVGDGVRCIYVMKKGEEKGEEEGGERRRWWGEKEVGGGGGGVDGWFQSNEENDFLLSNIDTPEIDTKCTQSPRS